MSAFLICPVCGGENPVDEVCRYHIAPIKHWARGNRIVCDLIHRKRSPTRLGPEDRTDDEPPTSP
jgi:hypothetical protein